MGELQKRWKDVSFSEYYKAVKNNSLTEEHTIMVLAILDDSNCFSPDSCGYVSLYVAKQYGLIY